MPQPSFYRPTYLEIDTTQILFNIDKLKETLKRETTVIPVIKADAYGHGAVEVARVLEEHSLSFFAVATPDEAVELRHAGIQATILVMGASPHRFLDYAWQQAIHVTAHSLEWLKTIPAKVKAHLHIKMDTGMGRLGLRSTSEVREAIEFVNSRPELQIEGVYTHFATADETENEHFIEQSRLFTEWLDLFPERPKWIHASNSAAAIQHPTMHFNAVRFGISMYGIAPSDWIRETFDFPFRPAMRLVTELVHVKQVEVGATVGYGAAYRSEKEEFIGTLPIGYADGFLRGLRHLQILIGEQRVPIAGKICMDQTMLILPEAFKVGTKVVLLGSNGNKTIPAEEWAEHLQTIPYEICCQISKRVPRVYPHSDKKN
ncbi:alanine racemase [Chryseomicrobium palamuruense]|uniref:Alanine racemase n=1 Tax=Chryseomicrobium palamuruense TaxID=682973 RepID=A0ABV8UWF5_9BACL